MASRFLTLDSEAVVQQQVCDYLRIRYPRAIFRSDYAAGLKLSMAQAVQHKRLQSSRAWPDLFIAEPRHMGPNYAEQYVWHGLLIEIKRENVKIYTRTGVLVADKHIREQAAMIERLRSRGYKAEFACGFTAARKLIDDYLGGTLPIDVEF